MDEQEPIIDYIYALTETESGIVWYIGRTISPHRRMTEHRYGSKNYKDGDENKYLYASQLDKLSINWDMEILQVCGPNTEFFEDYYINKFRNSPLQNMRAGDQEAWNGRDYSSPQEYVKFRTAELEKQKQAAKLAENRRNNKTTKQNSSRLTNRFDDSERTIFAGDFSDPNKMFVSNGFKELMEKRNQRKK